MKDACTGLQLLARRWAPEIILALDGEARRFNWLLAHVEGISDRMLSIRLGEMEALGLVRRDVEAGPPVRVTYELVGSAEQYVRPLRQLARLT